MKGDEGATFVELRGGEEEGGRRVRVEVDSDEGVNEVGWKSTKELEKLDSFLGKERDEGRERDESALFANVYAPVHSFLVLSLPLRLHERSR